MSDISAAVLSYLETLSRKDLIELINYFAATHEDIRLTLEEKTAVETAKNEDEAAADKQQLTQPTTDMFAQSSLESPLADTFIPLNALVNRNSTPKEKIDLYTS